MNWMNLHLNLFLMFHVSSFSLLKSSHWSHILSATEVSISPSIVHVVSYSATTSISAFPNSWVIHPISAGPCLIILHQSHSHYLTSSTSPDHPYQYSQLTHHLNLPVLIHLTLLLIQFLLLHLMNHRSLKNHCLNHLSHHLTLTQDHWVLHFLRMIQLIINR